MVVYLVIFYRQWGVLFLLLWFDCATLQSVLCVEDTVVMYTVKWEARKVHVCYVWCVIYCRTLRLFEKPSSGIVTYSRRVIKYKVKWSLYRPGMAQRLGSVIALLFHDCSTRSGWVVSSTPRPHFTPGKDPVTILQEAGWAPVPVWTGGKTRRHRDSIPDRPVRSSVAIPNELPGPQLSHVPH